MYRYLLFLFLSLSFQSIAQTITINGIVTDSAKRPLEYVNVGIVDKNIGTVTNKNGNFTLKYSIGQISHFDSLRFSSIGYFAYTIPTISIDSQAENFLSIELKQKLEEIPEVKILAKHLKHKEIGSHNQSLMNMFVKFSISEYPNQNLGSEIGRRFSIPAKNSLLKSLRFRIAMNNFDTVGFRINIYDIKNKYPAKNILHANIYKEVTNKKVGWVEIDLSKYNIIVDDDIIVTVEWVEKSTNGDLLALPLTMPTPFVHYYKFGSQNKWKRFNSMVTLMELLVKY